MIQIIQGTFGYYNGRKVVPITNADGPQKFDPELEARLVKQKIAKYVDLPEHPESPDPAGAGAPQDPDPGTEETEASAGISLPRGWHIDISANYTWSASINCGTPVNEADMSIGKQLPYVPRHSASAVLRVQWRGWQLAYKIQAYSERFTMSSNEHTITGHLPGYSLSNMSVDKSFTLFNLQWHAKAAVNNLFDATYRTVLSRPMPGINVECFLSLTI